MAELIDARGMVCPKPVILTKRALAEITEGSIAVLVDNQTAVNNISAFADSIGLVADVKSEGNDFKITIEKMACPLSVETNNAEKIVLLINSEFFGNGDEEFSRTLMRNFIFALTEVDPKPQTALFVNSGIKFTTEGSQVLESLQKLADGGMELLICGSCLDFYQLKDKLVIGSVTNMYSIAEKLLNADKVIKL